MKQAKFDQSLYDIVPDHQNQFYLPRCPVSVALVCKHGYGALAAFQILEVVFKKILLHVKQFVKTSLKKHMRSKAIAANYNFTVFSDLKVLEFTLKLVEEYFARDLKDNLLSKFKETEKSQRSWSRLKMIKEPDSGDSMPIKESTACLSISKILTPLKSCRSSKFKTALETQASSTSVR